MRTILSVTAVALFSMPTTTLAVGGGSTTDTATEITQTNPARQCSKPDHKRTITCVDGETYMEQSNSDRSVLTAAGNMLVTLAESKLADMANLQPQDFITEDMIRAAVRGESWGNWRGASWAAREYVFDQYQCSIFEHFEDANRYCNGILGYENTDGSSYQKVYSLPGELPTLSLQMRQQIYAVGRTYLKSPENLRTTYDTHVDIAVDEFNRMFFAGQQRFRAMLETMLTAIEESRDPAVAELLEAEKKAISNYRYQLKVDSTSKKTEEAKTVRDAAVAARENTVNDLVSLEFINRRFIEGGPNLVAMYEEIFTNFLARVSAN